ncbi:GNAT family N-acetyltransferase [uncultured Ilyobacter sp.]|uniref:bifunctional acetate--CoA ligase family protein/GNAT family N-acetyltransferase n=1 Tax=uncultured Ilyobacter sp. TaxID=544433 RepID=UPI0029F5A492|nr:GNAT family N-acetyltransferase [uncultured Ilyobacter sp.]
MSVRNLDALFRPTSIAVIGASNTPHNIGGVVVRNLLKSGFNGPIMPVNPKYQAIAGVLAYSDVESLPVTPDVAVICTPPKTVPELIEQLGQRGTRAAIVITAGLAHIEYRDGQSINDAMLAAARKYTLRILGPNCVGVLIPGLGLNASFSHTDIGAGSIAFISQSGGFCTATLDWAKARGIGFSHFVSLGNSADIDFGDVLDYFGAVEETKAILLYMESIGVDEARKFMSAARSAARNKPVLAIKAGRNAEGARAAASHTDALAGSDNVYDAALRRAGILRVVDLDELFDAVETLARSKPLHGERLAILTNGGGPGVIATDALIAEGGQLASFSPDTMRRLSDLLPGTWSGGNPVDMVGDADASVYAASLKVLFDDPGVDAILVLNAPSAIAPPVAAARGIVDIVRQAKLPILTSWLGGEAAGKARRIFAEAEIPTYDTPENAVRAFLHMVRFRRNMEILTQVPPSLPEEFSPTPKAARSVIETALLEHRELLTEPEAKAVLAAYGVPVVATRVANTPPQAAEVARQLGFPVALKVLSKDITHKSDVGGVVLGLDSMEEVEQAAAAMETRIAKNYPEAKLDGFTVQRMAQRPQAQELIVGMTTDSIFGPVILFGRGGTAVEVIADRAVALPPLNMSLARHLISRTQVSRLLKGYRDRPPADIDAICTTLIQISQLIVDRPEIIELDINPLFADDKGVLALDARIRVRPAESAGPERLAIRPYPRELEETMTTRDGRKVLVRPITPEDQPAHREFVDRLTAEDLRFRLGANRDIPPSEMSRLTQIDYDREMAFIAVAPNAEGKDETLAVVRTVALADNTLADLAIMVRSDLQRSGLGTALLKKMIEYCKSHGTHEIIGHVLRDNVAMLRLTEKLGFKHETSPDENRIAVRLALR